MSAELNVKLILDASDVAKQAKAGADEAKRQMESTMRSVSVGGGIAQIKQLPGFQEAKSNIAERTKQIKLEQALERMKLKTEADRAKNNNQLKSIFLAKPPGGSSLAKVQAMGDISQFGAKISLPKEPSGADLAKVQALGNINSFDKPPVLQQKSSIKNLLQGALTGLSNPYIGARILSDEFNKGGKGGGIFGKGGMVGFADVFIGLKVVSAILKAEMAVFKFAVEKFKQAVENASRIYAKSLGSGLGVSFTARREALSQIMGVSEEDVIKFGSALSVLNPKLDFSVGVMARTNHVLTSLSWEFGILTKDLEALFADMASQAAPAIQNLVKALDNLVRILDNPVILKLAGLGLKSAAQTASTTMLGPTFSTIAGYFISRLSTKDKSLISAPEPASFMKQLPASAWERMGLVIGRGGASNYAKDTAKNTRDSAVALGRLVSHMIASKTQSATAPYSHHIA